MDTDEAFADYDYASGCALVYGVLLALSGAVLIVYLVAAGLPAAVATAIGNEGALTLTLLLAGLAAVGLGAALWQAQPWARWLVMLLHSAAALAGLALAFLPLLGVEVGGRRLPLLATPATALMGVVVNVVIVGWFWRNRDVPVDES